ncbi:8837_t:CDS:2, partial [Diversispora eburnea]
MSQWYNIPKNESNLYDSFIPKLYAFNYHFDNDVFRRLAFANYQTPEETDLVVLALYSITKPNFAKT